GAGLTFAVLLDATVVRLVLLPALMRALGARAWWLPAWLDRLVPEFDHGEEPSAGERLGVVAEEEHHRLFEALERIQDAEAAGDPGRVLALTRELRALAEPHFRYEQEALFPLLLDEIGPDRVEGLYAAQAGVVESLARIEELAGRTRGEEPAARAETQRLLGSIRLSIEACHGLAEVVEHQPAEVAELVLAARERETPG
ncbi:MAG TPA: hemerythrin domain-containing protein, partial [Solirubrobacterales bacterium]